MLTYLNDGVGDFWTGNDRVCTHHSVGVLLSDFRNQEGAHAGTSSSPKGVSDLETWKTLMSVTIHQREKCVTNLGDNPFLQPPYAQHREQSQRAQLLPCNLKRRVSGTILSM